MPSIALTTAKNITLFDDSALITSSFLPLDLHAERLSKVDNKHLL